MTGVQTCALPISKDARAVLDIISREHVLGSMRAPMRHTIVERTMEMIERRGEVRDQHAALFDDEDALGAVPRVAEPPEEAPEDGPEPPAKPGRRSLRTEPQLKRRRPPKKA